MKKILGISAFYHDAAAAIVVDGKIIAAAQEERFTRKKHTADFPSQAIRYCLNEAGLDISELDAVVFYEKPFLKFERLLETYYAIAPTGLLSFLKSMPSWLNEKLFLKKIIRKKLKALTSTDMKKIKLLFSEHHLSHAASAFYPSPFQEAAILTIDGVGEWCTAAIGFGKDAKISFLKEMNFPHSLGLLYSAFTYYLGFEVNSGEYKLMGLAPYGNKDSEQCKQFVQTIKNNLVDIKHDGSIYLNQLYFKYTSGLSMSNNKRWKDLFGLERREEQEAIRQQHCDLALAIQQVTEEIVIKMAEEAKRLTRSNNLCLAGGVALNCVANGKLESLKIFDNIYIQPAAGDAGASIGAALAVNFHYFDAERNLDSNSDPMKGTYLGPSFSDQDIGSVCEQHHAIYHKFEDDKDLIDHIAIKLHEGAVVGWFQGRMEFGPRALGNRSILASPLIPSMHEKLNLKIKKREGFRPFAPAVAEEDAKKYFNMEGISAYMLFTFPLKENHRRDLPEDYPKQSIIERLKFAKSDFDAIAHVDFSARVQTVSKEQNSKFWDLLTSFKKLSGAPILINTSFNVRGEPLVCSPDDAYRCFMDTELDYLVMNNYFFSKVEQADAKHEKWKRVFKKD